jgi:hypothetical protein
VSLRTLPYSLLMYVYNLVPLCYLLSRVEARDSFFAMCFALIFSCMFLSALICQLTRVLMTTNTPNTAKRAFSLRDKRLGPCVHLLLCYILSVG